MPRQKIRDDLVWLVFRCPECNREEAIHPDFFSDSPGLPACPECVPDRNSPLDDDVEMEYVETQLEVPFPA